MQCMLAGWNGGSDWRDSTKIVTFFVLERNLLVTVKTDSDS